jgi:hypothetical protein
MQCAFSATCNKTLYASDISCDVQQKAGMALVKDPDWRSKALQDMQHAVTSLCDVQQNVPLCTFHAVGFCTT